MNNLNYKIKKTGFTLLETLVAIMLFTIAISALLALVTDSVTSAGYTKNEVIATYLAQEGVDYIRNVRDEVVHQPNSSSTPWTDFTNLLSTKGCSTGSQCMLDVYDATPLQGCLGICKTLYLSDIDTVNDLPERYVLSGGVQLPGTLFRRIISVSNPSPSVVLVKVDVVWYNGVNQRTRSLTTTLYDWAL